MATDVSICSNALLRLGSQPISSFTEGDTTGSNLNRARLCANLWPTVRKQVLRSHTWNSCIKRALLSPDSIAPAFGYTNRFQIPSDWLRTIFVGTSDCDRYAYRTEGGYFLSDEAAFPLVYAFDNTNAATYDAALVGVLEQAMTVVLAYPVTKSTSLRDELNAELKEMLKLARGVDTQDDPNETVGDFPMRASRFGNWR